jgi:glycosyltransferase involved in cell wall biosynthesis
MPAVSVVMAVNNGLPYLEEAVRSILSQTFQDYEFVIVDDASTDESRAFIESLPEERTKIILNETQKGLSRSLNRGIESSSGKYIARMDHDDVCLPTRLMEQVAFLEANPDVDLMGTWAKTIGRTPEQIWRYPSKDEDIRSEFVFNSCLVHSSVMWRRSTFEKNGLAYDGSIVRAQDYEPWTRAKNQIHFANIPRLLIYYRIHPSSVGSMFGGEQQAAADRVRERELAQLGFDPSTVELGVHHAISRWEFPRTIEELLALEAWLSKLYEANRTLRVYPVAAFGRALERRWWAACRANARMGGAAWRMYKASPVRGLGDRSLSEEMVFGAKAIANEFRKQQ